MTLIWKASSIISFNIAWGKKFTQALRRPIINGRKINRTTGKKSVEYQRGHSNRIDLVGKIKWSHAHRNVDEIYQQFGG